MSRLISALLISALCLTACSSTSEAHHSASVSTPEASASSSSGPRPDIDLGFDFVYDTVSSGFSHGQVWINRHGVSHALPGHGYQLINPVPGPDGKSLLVKRLSADGDPGSGDIAVIDLTGKVIEAVPHTDGCFPGGWANDHVLLGCGVGTDESSWKAYLVRLSDGSRQVIGPTCPGCGGAEASPDGKTIEYPWKNKVSFLPVTLGRPTLTLVHNPGGAWTPDGRHLLGVSDTASGKKALQLMNLDGTHRHTLVTFDWQQDLTSMESPDGKHVILAGSSDTPHSFWEVDTNGKALHQLQSSLPGGDPAVLP